MIFQDPSSSLNPVIRAGRQIAEAVELHRGLTAKAARFETIRLMELVGIPDAVRRFDNFPHEFSGGQNQRLMIAMALSGNPDLLVADEPTTALDATIQAQILDLLISIRAETGMAIVFISHDLGAVSQVCERVRVGMPAASSRSVRRKRCSASRAIPIRVACSMPFHAWMAAASAWCRSSAPCRSPDRLRWPAAPARPAAAIRPNFLATTACRNW